MKIQTSKFRMMIYLISITFIELSPLFLLWWFIPNGVTFLGFLSFVLGVCILKAIYKVVREINDIVVTEDHKMIGGNKVRSFKLNDQHFISETSIDLERTIKRSWVDTLLGRYIIVDKSGLAFEFNRYFFQKETLTKLNLS